MPTYGTNVPSEEHYSAFKKANVQQRKYHIIIQR